MVVFKLEYNAIYHFLDEDKVPVEETGLSPLCLEDFFNDTLPWPQMTTGGFPCQDLSSAYLQGGEGIEGEKSGLVFEQLRIMENLEIEMAVFENSWQLNKKGLAVILIELNELGYCVEWETISATAFGYPHFRHRLFIVCYLKTSPIYKNNIRIMDLVRGQAQRKPTWKMPLLSQPQKVLKSAVAIDTRSIKLRTKRINSLGNSIVLDIPEAILNAISDSYGLSAKLKEIKPITSKKTNHLFLTQNGWVDKSQSSLFDQDTKVTSDMPRNGFMDAGVINYSATRCPIFDPTNTKYSNLFSTLIRKDGNNTFTTKSRLSRPGKLGGLVGEIMGIGASVGGLHPEFCEEFMGYPKGYTELAY
ncbi:MAG: hypothetical protein ACI936_000047 [Paraglaciecola sp.]